MAPRKRLAILLAVATGAALIAATPVRTTAPRLQHPYAAEFPPGAGKAIADRSCAVCHSPMLITQQAKDSTAWEKTLGQMQKWGVALTPAEHDTLRDYLVAKFANKAATTR